jgi:hypothetical protein
MNAIFSAIVGYSSCPALDSESPAEGAESVGFRNVFKRMPLAFGCAWRLVAQAGIGYLFSASKHSKRKSNAVPMLRKAANKGFLHCSQATKHFRNT